MRRQRGAALLVAMLVVTLVATFSAAALWQQWRAVEVEAAERSRMQAGWILTGALDWARLIIREDSRSPNGSVDHLAEPWAVPLQEARLSTFLAADASGTDTSVQDDVFLSGFITDQQGLLNLANLVGSGTTLESGLRSFRRLFGLLGLPASQVDTLSENLRFANDISTDNPSAGQAPIAPQRIEDAVWLGIPQSTVTAILPYVTLLPSPSNGRTLINLNTASAEVIFAAVDGMTLADAQQLVARRAQTPFRTVGEATQMFPQYAGAISAAANVNTQFFEVRARLRIERLVVEERSLLKRDGLNVTTIWRERGVIDPAAIAQAGASR
jgi:general secretion pathway protein K